MEHVVDAYRVCTLYEVWLNINIAITFYFLVCNREFVNLKQSVQIVVVKNLVQINNSWVYSYQLRVDGILRPLKGTVVQSNHTFALHAAINGTGNLKTVACKSKCV